LLFSVLLVFDIFIEGSFFLLDRDALSSIGETRPGRLGRGCAPGWSAEFLKFEVWLRSHPELTPFRSERSHPELTPFRSERSHPELTPFRSERSHPELTPFRSERSHPELTPFRSERSHPELTPFRSERSIYGEEERPAGDLVAMGISVEDLGRSDVASRPRFPSLRECSDKI
jgi:hypothetical protein